MTFSILQLTFDIPNVSTLKQKCLSSVAEKFHGFKTKLTSRYVFGHKKNENPLLKYTWIDEDRFLSFGHLRDDRYVYLKSSIAQSIIMQNFN